MQDQKAALSRRNLFAGAATVGAVAAATSLLPGAVKGVAEQAATQLRYYQTTRV